MSIINKYVETRERDSGVGGGGCQRMEISILLKKRKEIKQRKERLCIVDRTDYI